MAYRKQYGMRHDAKTKEEKTTARTIVIRLLLFCGSISYRALDILEKAGIIKRRWFAEQLNRMRDEDVTKVSCSPKGGKYAIFANYSAIKKRLNENAEFTPDEWEYYESNYYEEFKNRGIRIPEEQKRRTRQEICRRKREREKQEARLDRGIRMGEVEAMMYSIGVPHGISKGQKGYISSKEIKSEIKSNAENGSNTFATAKKKVGSSSIDASHVMGLYSTGSECYAIYNAGKRLIEWNAESEKSMGTQLAIINRNVGHVATDGNQYKIPAIVFTYKYENIIELMNLGFNPNEEKTTDSGRKRVAIKNIENAYKELYFVPYDVDGRNLIKIISRVDWQKKLNHVILKDNEHTKTKAPIVDCEAYDPETATYTFNFCRLDLIYIRKALNHIHNHGNYRYVVYCFEFQKETVEKLTDNRAEIKTVNISKCLRDLRKLAKNNKTKLAKKKIS